MDQYRPIDARTHRALAAASRVRVLEHLRARSTPLAVPEIAARVGLHPNTVRLHLDRLADAGLVTRTAEAPGGRGRPRHLYAAAIPPAGAVPPESDGAEDYRALAGILAGRLEASGERAADDAAAAGRAWGRELVGERRSADPVSATDRLVGLMDRLGFAPSVPAAGGPIELRRCPFRQVAEEHSAVVCGVHLGLMQGALESLGAPLRATRLDPFVAPGRCRAHLDPIADPPVPHRHPTEGVPS